MTCTDTKHAAIAAALDTAETLATTDPVGAALHLLDAGVYTLTDGVVRSAWCRHSSGAVLATDKRLASRLLTLPGGLRVSTAQVVWAATHGERVPEGCQLKHLDGDATNNHPANLRVVTLQAERQAATGQLSLLDVPAVAVERKTKPAPQCAPVKPVMARTLGLDGMAEHEPVGIPRGVWADLMERFEVSVSEVHEVTGDDVADVRRALHGLDGCDLRAGLLDVAFERLSEARDGLRIDASRPELWADVANAAAMAAAVMEVG